MKNTAFSLAQVPFEQMFQASALPMLIILPKTGEIVEANQAAAHFYGFSISEICQRTIFDFNTLTREEVLQEMRLAAAYNKNTFRFEHRLADHSVRQVEVISTPLMHGPDAPLCSVIHDVSEFFTIQQREQLIQQTLEKHYHLLHAVLNGTHKRAMLVVDPTGVLRLLNKPAENILGLHPVQATGKPLATTLFGEEIIANIQRELSLPASTPLAWPTLFAKIEAHALQATKGWVRPEGLPAFRAEVHFSTLKEESDTVSGLLILIENIENQEQAAEKLKLAASVFSEASEGILITSTDGKILDVNQAFCIMTGYDRQELVGQNPRMLKSGHQEPHFYQQMWESIHATGHWFGELWNRRKNGQIYAEELTITAVKDDQGKVSHYIGLLSDITDRKHQQATIEHLAYYDALTQLPNRILLGDRMRQALAHNARGHGLIAVCYLDLDGFKPVNDKYGHKTGDLLLIEVAKRLQDCVRNHDTVARLGGDEFVIVMTQINTPEETDRILHRVLHTLHKTFRIDGYPDIHVGASIGVAHYPVDGQDADTLLRHADHAMYQAKDAGRHTVHYFNPAQDEQIHQHHQFRNEIRRALEDDAFTLHWQPWVDLSSGKILGYEGLLRWVKDNRNIWLPATFLERLENDNLLIAIGNRVLEQAYEALDQTFQYNIAKPISLNISLRHWQGKTFIQKLRQLSETHPRVPSSFISLEIKESELLANMDELKPIIREVRGLGYKVIIDGLGAKTEVTDYPYLALADAVKLSSYLLHDMLENDQALLHVQTLHLACQKRNVPIIAKQLELIEQIVVLLRLDITQGQGYAIYPTLSALPLQPSEEPNIELNVPTLHLAWPIDDSALATAIPEHRRWLQKLHKLMLDGATFPYQKGNTLDCCRLGDWMHGKGQRWAHLPEFNKLEKEHQHFRRLVSEAVAAIQTAPQNMPGILDQATSELGRMADTVDLLIHDITKNSK
ncbi:diguanylate cyclase [Leeia sp. TBRC 13508]|uniref:Diguanylate cyclase n=1 Tax=Leeia speluncae TaxID=2884804 RepID=A0ABS8D4H5_9NEIS|nr:diguanylate cyclase [Leeia speluncae]MCB6183097.1 diguanylate cyclase [Leeia speluncae]